MDQRQVDQRSFRKNKTLEFKNRAIEKNLDFQDSAEDGNQAKKPADFLSPTLEVYKMIIFLMIIHYFDG